MMPPQVGRAGINADAAREVWSAVRIVGRVPDFFEECDCALWRPAWPDLIVGLPRRTSRCIEFSRLTRWKDGLSKGPSFSA